MSYIEKEKLIKADIASIENRVRHVFNQGYDLGFKDGKEKAKPLEQETQTFKWCETCKEYDQEKHCCHRWSKVIRDTAEEMKQEPRWIPVSEYLPVTNDEVLVTYIVNGNAKKRYVETANCFDGEWSSVNDEYRIPNTKIEIIAWCEMPKPYKAESEK